MTYICMTGIYWKSCCFIEHVLAIIIAVNTNNDFNYVTSILSSVICGHWCRDCATVIKECLSVHACLQDIFVTSGFKEYWGQA